MKVVPFVKESISDFLYKVTWPRWQEVQRTTGVVIIGTVIFALIIYVIDLAVGNVLTFLYDVFLR